MTEKVGDGVKPKEGKVKNFFSNLRANWHTSTKEGEHLGYKEILSYSFLGDGVNGIGNLAIFTQLTSFTILIGSIYKLSPVILYLMTSVLTFIGLVKTPILSFIMDNTGKKGGKSKFKPFLYWMGIPAIIFTCLIPYVPVSWINITSFIIFEEPVSRAAIVIFLLQVLISFTWPVVGVAYGGLGQTLTPNTLERAKLFSFQPILSSFWPSIIGIAFPLLSLLTIGSAATGQESILSYRVFMPIFGIVSFLFILLAKNCEERIVVEKDYKPKVKFKHGVKSLAANKYFWILTISGIFGMVKISGNIISWINIYSLQSDLATSITTTLLGNAMVPGMLLTGYMVGKFGKKNLILGANVIMTLLYIPMALLPNRPILLLFMIFFQNMAAGFIVCQAIMPADALDAQQLKTGERLEGFWGLFNQMILGIFALLTGLITPLVLRASGMPEGADILVNEVIRYKVFTNLSIMSGIASLLATIPFIFWDLTEEKHKDIIRQLERIAKEKNGVDDFNHPMI